MKLHKFEAENNHKAMQLVQKELGMDAYIYSTRRVPGGVEILAGSDKFAVSENESDMMENQDNKQWLVKLTEDINEIKNKLTEFNVGLRPNVQNDFVLLNTDEGDYKQIVEKFKQMHFSHAFIYEYLIKYLPCIDTNQNIEQIIESVLDDIILIDNQALNPFTKSKVLVGPTGAGKTLSIAKLADLYIKNGESKDDIVMITTDFNDIAGMNQSNYYSNTLDVCMEYAHDAKELKYLVEKLPQPIKLIDTFGISKRDNTKPEQLFSYFKEINYPLDFILTLPANVQEELLLKSLNEFTGYPISSCFITKEDESINLANAIAACIRHKTKISFIGNGQSIQGALRLANKKQLIKGLMRSVNDLNFIK